MPTPIAVLRNDAPLVLLSLGAETTLVAARTQLRQQGLILDSDVFVDQKGFPVPQDSEPDWTLADLLARSDEQTVRLKSTEREAKKSAMARLLAAAAKAEPPETPSAPELAKDKGLAPLEADTKARDIHAPVAGVTLGSDAIADPVLLDKEAWRNIIDRNNLLRGIRLDDDPPSSSFKPAFAIVGGVPRFVVQDSAFVSATVTHSESAHAMVVNKFSKVEASASYCFVSSSFERSTRDSQAETTSAAQTYVVGSWNLPRVVVQLRPEDLTPDPAMTAAVEAIVTRPDSAELKYFALRRLFREYGQVWASEVTLGGQLTITDTLTVTDRKQEKAAEAAMRLAVAAKVGAFKAGAGAAVGADSVERSSQFKQFQDKQFHATGGDTRLTQEPGSWVSTIGPAANWRVIARRRLMPLYMVLEESLRQKVRDILANVDARFMPELMASGPPAELAWREAVRAENDGFLVVQLLGCPAGRAEVWGVASGANGVPGSPFACTTLWGPPGAGGERMKHQTVTLPVRRRDMMMFEPLHVAGPPVAPAVAAAGRWYEMAHFDEAYFDPPVRPTTTAGSFAAMPCESWMPPSDGFLLVSIRAVAGDTGDVMVREDDDGVYARILLDAAATGLTHGAACLPVRKGRGYKIVMPVGRRPGMSATVDLRFVAINPHLGALGEPSARDPAISYLAESDGFLIGSFETITQAVAHVTLFAGPDREEFRKQGPVGALSLLRLGAGCLGVPIRKNSFYHLDIAGTPEPCQVERLQFFPLRRF